MIYLDNNATTKVKDEVKQSIINTLDLYGNSSSNYSIGFQTNKLIKHSRDIISNKINCKPSEIYFTSCGSESDNWAIKGISYANKNKGNHIITTKIEHKAILNSCKFLEKQGFEITYLNVDKLGRIDLNELENAIKPTTILISVMFANNEIGTIQPIKEIGDIARKHNILFHTDAVQVFGLEKIDVQELNIDLMSVSGHKIGCPKGIGFLYIRNGIKIENLIHGGKQELGLRSGTENTPYIVGLGKSVELIDYKLKEDLTNKRDYFINKLKDNFQDIIINGDLQNRLSNNINVCFKNIEAESLQILLDINDICVSSGSACNTGSLEPSYVLKAINVPEDYINGSIRFSISGETSYDDIDYVIKKLKEIIKSYNT